MRTRVLLIGLGVLLLVAAVTSKVLLTRAADGPVLRTVTLASSPWAATLDEQTGRLYMVNRSFGGGFLNAGGSAGGGGLAVGGGGFPGGNTISMLDTRGGSSTHAIAVGEDPRSVAMDPRHGLAYVTNDDDASVSVLDMRSGAVLHTTQVGARPHALAVDGPTNRVFVVNTSDRTVSVLDARQSKVLRLVHVPEAVDNAGAVVDTRTNRVFIAGGGSVSVLDGRNGALLQSISLDGDRVQSRGPEITPMVVDERTGQVFVLGTGVLNVLDAATGRLVRSISVGINASALALDARHGHLLLTSTGAEDPSGGVHGAGTLQLLDAGTGAVLKTISLGVTPSAVAVDERAGHVIVVDSGGDRRVADPWGWLPNGIRKRLSFLPAPSSRTQTEPGSVLVLDLSRL